jgi:hypothetical protein
MANRYENHRVVASFELGIKPGQIMALSTFKQKITEIQSKFSGSYEEKTSLVLKELQNLLIEEVILESDPDPKLVVKGSDTVSLQLIASEPITNEELTERKLDLISKVQSINFLRNLLADEHLSYDQLERAILQTSDPVFLKQVIRNQEMPYIELHVDHEVLKIASFEIPKEWMNEGVITLNDYELKKVDDNGTMVLSVPEGELPNKQIGEDRFVVVKVDTKTNEFRILKYLKNTNVRVSVDLVKMRKAKRQCPYYKLVKLHNADGLIQSTLEDIVALKEKLNYS